MSDSEVAQVDLSFDSDFNLYLTANVDTDDCNLLNYWQGDNDSGAAEDKLLRDQLPKKQVDETDTDIFNNLVNIMSKDLCSLDYDTQGHYVAGEISQSIQDVQSPLLPSEKMFEDSTQDLKKSTDIVHGLNYTKHLDSSDILNSSCSKVLPLLVKQESNKKVESTFENPFYKVHDSASEISGFYLPFLSKDKAKPDVFSAIVNAIKSTNESRRKNAKKMQGPICGIIKLQQICKACNKRKEGKMPLYAGYISSHRKNINSSITDLYHCMWFVPKEGKDKTEIKKDMKKLKKVARAKPNERKVVILDEDIKKYCDGKYKLPAHMMNTPVIVLKQTEFDKAVLRFGDNSKKRKAERNDRDCKRAKYEIPKEERYDL